MDGRKITSRSNDAATAAVLAAETQLRTVCAQFDFTFAVGRKKGTIGSSDGQLERNETSNCCQSRTASRHAAQICWCVSNSDVCSGESSPAARSEIILRQSSQFIACLLVPEQSLLPRWLGPSEKLGLRSGGGPLAFQTRSNLFEGPVESGLHRADGRV